MHGLFHDDMCIYFPKNNGRVIYNWQYVDDVYDRLLAQGVKPFVELGFFPKEIAAPNSRTQFWWKGNVSVDQNNFGKWHDLIAEFTKHVVERYGIEEVLTWYFEVWNEPNLTGEGAFFHGTRSDYFRLYKEAANAIKSVDKRLRVGGPATSNFIADHRHDSEKLDYSKSRFYSQDQINKQQWKGIWIEDFIKFCTEENLPIDFISCHPYPTDYALDPEEGKGKNAIRYVNSLYDDLTWLNNVVSKSKYSNAEIHLTEWSTSPNSRDCTHDLLQPAAYIIKVTLDCLNMANSLMYWTFTDVFEEKGGGEEIFHGGFGLINYQGIVKPSFHAFRMLHNLGDELLYYSDPLVVSRFHDSGKIAAIAFNYPDEFFDHVPGGIYSNQYDATSSKNFDLQLTSLIPNTSFEIEILDNFHGNAINEFRKMGSPHSLSIAQTNLLKELSWATQKMIIKADEHGILTYKTALAPWSCVLIHEL
jgi:xylan 1,4-beta-xylosidase